MLVEDGPRNRTNYNEREISMSDQITHLVQYSGGVGSFAVACWCRHTYGKENVVLLFSDTLIEDPDLYRFNEDVKVFLGCRFVTLCDGRTPWEVFRDKRFLGNSRVDPCSKVLKRDICTKWVKQNYSPENCRIYVGIDWTEAHRVKNIQRLWEGWDVEAPLTYLRFYKAEFMQKMAEVGITPPRLYALGFPHNNCGGACVKAGKAHFAHLLKTLPDVYAEWEMRERELREFLNKDVTILKEQVKGKQHYITLQVLRERLESENLTEDEQLEWGGCGCFSDIPDDEKI